MTSKTLEDLWDAYERRLETDVPAYGRLHAIRESKLSKAHSALRKLANGVAVEIVFAVVPMVLLGGFIADHAGTPKYLLPALALVTMTAFQLAFGVYQLGVLHDTDFSTPVIALQKRLAQLRVHRIQVVRLTLLVSPLLWVPLLLVAIKGITGADPYAILDSGWLLANVIFGAAVIPIGWWVSRHFAHRFGRTHALRRVMDDIAGRSLVDAMTYLDDLAQFEHEAERR